jgi:hypothetical protein
MDDLLERIAAINPVQAHTLAPSVDDVWHKLDDDPGRRSARRRTRHAPEPPRRRVVRRLAAIGASLAVAGLAFLMLGPHGGGPSQAFAGWTAAPTAPASGQTESALGRCRSRLAQPGGGPASGIPLSGWQASVTDTRGPFTALVLHSGVASAMCLTGPSFTSSAATIPGSYIQQWRLSGTDGGTSGPLSLLGLGFSVPRGAGPLVTQALQADLATHGGQPYTLVFGQLTAGVRHVTLVLSDGRKLAATVGGRSFLAWWPGSAGVRSAQVTNAAGASARQLAVASLSAPHVSSTHTAPRSP